MGGICGVVGAVDEAVLRAMTGVMTHRGPDDEGSFFDLNGPSMLGIRRLSIIDSAGGHQPIHNENETVWVVCNGEIYNYLELKDFLEKKGHCFYTKTDTEVIVHAYEEYGESCVHLLRGMFAFAVWDTKKQRLVLARDRLGEKPLYYWQGSGKLVFGSEIKAILQHPDVPREVDLEAMQLYLAFGYVPAPWSMFGGIKKLPPGHYLVSDSGGVAVKCYWDVTFLDVDRRVKVVDAVDEIHWRLKEAVRLRLNADDLLGALLSGGVNSLSILAVMAQLSPTRVKTFTIGFDGGGWRKEFDTARLVAERYHTDHYETVLSALDVPELLSKIVWHLDEPIADPEVLPTYLMCEFARRHVAAVLTGAGGDAVFGGHPHYAWVRLAKECEQWLPSWMRSTLLRATGFLPFTHTGHHRARLLLGNLSDEQRYLAWIGMGPEDAILVAPITPTTPHDLVASYLSGFQNVTSRNSPSIHSLTHRLMYLDMKTWLPDNVLTRLDKMSMTFSLEARSPYLDHRLVEFIAALPAEVKIQGHQTKWLLRKAVADPLPKAISRLPKQAFRVPVGSWLRGDLRSYVNEQLLTPGAAIRRYLSHEQVQRLIHEHLNGQANHEQALWAILCFEQWHRMFINRQSA